jgi:hypothetical protein
LICPIFYTFNEKHLPLNGGKVERNDAISRGKAKAKLKASGFGNGAKEENMVRDSIIGDAIR